MGHVGYFPSPKLQLGLNLCHSWFTTLANEQPFHVFVEIHCKRNISIVVS